MSREEWQTAFEQLEYQWESLQSPVDQKKFAEQIESLRAMRALAARYRP